MEITNSIKYVGVNDHEIDLFEGQYIVPNGMAYNSYVILDEKIAVIDTVDERFGDEWLNNISSVLGKNLPDYLIIEHMEPDHSANIDKFMLKYPNATIVSTAQAFNMIKQFFGKELTQNKQIVTDGSTLSLGTHNLKFITAPMVHWPEVVMVYDETEKVLFSADAFGKFGALDADEEWACEARRYYIGIVGKYGAQVQALFKKFDGVDIQIICPLHGPILTENLGYYLNLYQIWSSYAVETEGVVIAYTSVYGNTKKAALLLAEKLEDKGVKVAVNDLARCDMAEAVEDAFRYGKIVFATTTYNADIFPFMRKFLSELVERNFQNKTVAFIENGSWAPIATKVMKEKLSNCKNLNYSENNIKIISALSEANIAEIEALANELAK